MRTMLTVDSEKRATISDICSHYWVNDGYPQTCLEEAEHLASLTPVRLDLLLSLGPGGAGGREEVVVQTEEEEKPEVRKSGNFASVCIYLRVLRLLYCHA